jgi:methylmalonyl-CoA/ethylmalonyl-CoA epimerase
MSDTTNKFRINHVAIVVPNIDEGLAFWRDALGLLLGERRHVAQEAVDVAFLEAGDAHLELVQPTTDDSGVAQYLAKKGAGMHHLCLEVDDLEAAVQRLREHGAQLLNDAPRERDGIRYVFVHPRSTGGVLLELYELPR